MQFLDGRPVYSATDLVGYLACSHLTDLERCKQLGLVQKPERSDPELEIIIKRGFEHEQAYIGRLRAQGRDVHDVSGERPEGLDRDEHYRALAADTRAAIERGDDVIFQACFFDGTWLGFADFLLRKDDPGAPLGWSYEVADTKLAHSVKAGALLQICVYNEMLGGHPGRLPRQDVRGARRQGQGDAGLPHGRLPGLLPSGASALPGARGWSGTGLPSPVAVVPGARRALSGLLLG